MALREQLNLKSRNVALRLFCSPSDQPQLSWFFGLSLELCADLGTPHAIGSLY